MAKELNGIVEDLLESIRQEVVRRKVNTGWENERPDWYESRAIIVLVACDSIPRLFHQVHEAKVFIRDSTLLISDF